MSELSERTKLGRRTFLMGVATGSVLVGGTVILAPALIQRLETPSVPHHYPNTPLSQFNSYPITYWNDLYQLFLYSASIILGSFRDTDDFMEIHRDIWNSIVDKDFFIYANDWMSRVQERTGDYSLLLPPDRTTGRVTMADSIAAYPEGWAIIVHEMIGHTPSLAKAFFVRGLQE